ncbi:GNAT family N-acetyltransferase, partial [Proteus myxofaciens]|uniref:GNAT family N-acetyltransferase n=1 Tax=Proteus myxofaciens TaxID=184072 RepID=UPI000833038A
MSQSQILAKSSLITVRQTRIGDASKLPTIESSAGQLFSTIEDLSWISTEDVQDVDSHLAFIEKQFHWVAVNKDDEPVGFIMVDDLPESLFIHEISVSSAWQNKGIGKQLIQKVIDEAKARQYS